MSVTRYVGRYQHLHSRKLSREHYFLHLPHRCCKCQTRRTLDRLWSLYLRPPKCKACGWYRLKPCFDRLAAKRGRGRAEKCDCQGYHFPHRRRSKFCYENPQSAQHHTERWEALA